MTMEKEQPASQPKNLTGHDAPTISYPKVLQCGIKSGRDDDPKSYGCILAFDSDHSDKFKKGLFYCLFPDLGPILYTDLHSLGKKMCHAQNITATLFNGYGDLYMSGIEVPRSLAEFDIDKVPVPGSSASCTPLTHFSHTAFNRPYREHKNAVAAFGLDPETFEVIKRGEKRIRLQDYLKSNPRTVTSAELRASRKKVATSRPKSAVTDAEADRDSDCGADAPTLRPPSPAQSTPSSSVPMESSTPAKPRSQPNSTSAEPVSPLAPPPAQENPSSRSTSPHQDVRGLFKIGPKTRSQTRADRQSTSGAANKSTTSATSEAESNANKDMSVEEVEEPVRKKKTKKTPPARRSKSGTTKTTSSSSKQRTRAKQSKQGFGGDSSGGVLSCYDFTSAAETEREDNGKRKRSGKRKSRHMEDPEEDSFSTSSSDKGETQDQQKDLDFVPEELTPKKNETSQNVEQPLRKRPRRKSATYLMEVENGGQKEAAKVDDESSVPQNHVATPPQSPPMPQAPPSPQQPPETALPSNASGAASSPVHPPRPCSPPPPPAVISQPPAPAVAPIPQPQKQPAQVPPQILHPPAAPDHPYYPGIILINHPDFDKAADYFSPSQVLDIMRPPDGSRNITAEFFKANRLDMEKVRYILLRVLSQGTVARHLESMGITALPFLADWEREFASKNLSLLCAPKNVSGILIPRYAGPEDGDPQAILLSLHQKRRELFEMMKYIEGQILQLQKQIRQNDGSVPVGSGPSGNSSVPQPQPKAPATDAQPHPPATTSVGKAPAQPSPEVPATTASGQPNQKAPTLQPPTLTCVPSSTPTPQPPTVQTQKVTNSQPNPPSGPIQDQLPSSQQTEKPAAGAVVSARPSNRDPPSLGSPLPTPPNTSKPNETAHHAPSTQTSSQPAPHTGTSEQKKLPISVSPPSIREDLDGDSAMSGSSEVKTDSKPVAQVIKPQSQEAHELAESLFGNCVL